MNSKEMWEQFCIEKNVDPAVFHEAWQFGGAPDKLARLVLEGKKTATSSGYDLYTLDANEKVPQSGDYSVILDSRNEAVCVIRTCKTYVCPFLEVSKEHAKKEGGRRFKSFLVAKSA